MESLSCFYSRSISISNQSESGLKKSPQAFMTFDISIWGAEKVSVKKELFPEYVSTYRRALLEQARLNSKRPLRTI